MIQGPRKFCTIEGHSTFVAVVRYSRQCDGPRATAARRNINQAWLDCY